MTTAWVMLVMAGMLEIGWAIGLKYTDGFSFARRPLATGLTLLAMAGSFYLLALAIRSIPIGTGYAIWTGIGAVGAATLGMVLFKEPATPARIACLLMIVAGIIGLKMTAAAGAAPTVVPNDTGPREAALYIGAKDGIYRAAFDGATGRLGDARRVAELSNASFLARHPTLRVLYALSEVGDFGGEAAGGVLAYAIDADGTLRELGRRSSRGRGPCHLSVDPSGRVLFVANYAGGNVASFLLDGSTGLHGDAASVDAHAGSGPHPTRQDRAYAHSIIGDPSGRFAISADLGTDSIFVYAVDAASGELERTGETKLEPGTGPRHMAFGADGATLYVLGELSNTIDRFAWDATAGTLSRSLGRIGTLPDGFNGASAAAEIAVHPNGRFVYASNRGHDSIAVFRVGVDGALQHVDRVDSGGRSPRHFAIVPSGAFAFVANGRSDAVKIFGIDGATGVPFATGLSVQVPAPACVRFVD